MFPRRYFSLPYTRNSQLLVTFWSQELQPHAISQAGKDLKRSSAETPDWSSHLWDHPTGFGADALWKLPRVEITQLPLQAACSKAQIFPGKNLYQFEPTLLQLHVCISHPPAAVPLWRDRLCVLHLLPGTQGCPLLPKLDRPCSSGGSSQAVLNSWPPWGALCSYYPFL